MTGTVSVLMVELQRRLSLTTLLRAMAMQPKISLPPRSPKGQGMEVSTSVLDTIQRYRDYPGIGSVVYASGTKRKNKAGKSMDWAIVVLSTPGPDPGQNLPPPKISLQPITQTNGETNFGYSAHPDEVISVVGQLIPEGWAWKKGRTTGGTTGNFNSIQSNILWEQYDGHYEITDEHTMIGYGGQITARPGDSGSIVINQKKEWVSFFQFLYLLSTYIHLNH